MSENSSETNKRTCIICGCHTNQTINIYEPRNGPNIVRLIQARFKFQPLSDDKYLCYSCNNWLINWHSLQALNSNDADNPAGTLRPSHDNNIEPERGSSSAGHMKKCTKPIAQVQPRLQDQPETKSLQLPKRECHSTKTNYSKRTFLSWHRIKKNRRKSLHVCSVCGRTILRRTLGVRSKSTAIMQCKRCHEILLWHKMYLKTVKMQKEKRLSKDKFLRQNHSTLVNETSTHPSVHMPYQPRRYQRPLIDGKVVSMLRRLGTTLSRDTTSASCAHKPPIMSPQKKKCKRWTRDIADDEILINFNTAITEVLPIRHIRRRLTYHTSDTMVDPIELTSSDEEDDVQLTADEDISLEDVYSLVPKGLTVSLIPNSEPVLSN